MRAIEPLTQLHSTHSEFAQEGCQKETEHLTNMSHKTQIYMPQVHATKYMPHVQHALQDLNMLNKSIQLYFFRKKQHNNPMHFLCCFYAVCLFP